MGKESISSGRSWESVLFWAFFLLLLFSILSSRPICFHGYFHCTVYIIYIYNFFF